jgi:xanthine dehydrogenase accessory factor
MTEIQSILAALSGVGGQPAALATLVSVRGSSYRRPGARTLLVPHGAKVGSISGGCLEEDVALRLQSVLESGMPQLVTYDTTDENDLVWGVGLGCQGVVQILIERIPAARPGWIAALASNLREGRGTELAVEFAGSPTETWGTSLAEGPWPGEPERIFRQRIEPPPRLIIFGAGADAMPLSQMAQQVGWRVTVADSRAAGAVRARFPGAETVLVAPAGSIDEHVELDGGCFVVLMSHRYYEDLSVLRVLLGRPLAYLGILGPRKRTERLLAQLEGEGAAIEPDTLRKLCAPVGLDLGATTPETIALSILAEMQSHLTGRIPIPLRERNAAIHG